MVNNNALNNLNERLGMDDAKLNELRGYRDLYNIIQSQGTEGLGPKFSKNLDFLKQKADEYNDIFSRRNINANVINEFNNKYGALGPNYSGDTLSKALPKMSDEYTKNNQEILNKIETLGSQYGKEKAGFFNNIQSDHDALKAGILGQAQEQEALTEGLTTRRGMGTKAMEDVSKTNIENNANASIGAVDSNETTQLMETSKLYNTLLNNLIQQYKATKDQYVLGKIQNAVNILSALGKYGSKTA